MSDEQQLRAAIVEMLRWRTGPHARSTRERHEIVRMATGTELPDEATELADPREADGHYRIAQDELRRVAAKGDHPALRRSVILEGDPFGGPVAMRLGVGGSGSSVGRTRWG